MRRGGELGKLLREDPLRLVRVEQVEAAGLLDADALVVRHVHRHVRPVRLRDVGVLRRAQDLGGVEVDDQGAPGALAGTVERDHAVDVLG